MTNLTIKPKTLLPLVFIFIFCSLNSLAQTDFWVQKSDLGHDAANVQELTPRIDAVSFSIGSKGYIGTGSSYLGFMRDFWEYNPANDSWTQKADFGGAARRGAIGFNIGNKGYIGTGESNLGFMKDFWEYNPVTNIWTQKVDFGGTARSGAACFSIGNKGYLGTGYYYDGVLHYHKDFWEYNPVVDTWTQKADFGGAVRFLAVGFSIGDKGYLGTGNSYDGAYFDYKDFWEYDPVADTWMQKADFGGGAREAAVGFSIENKGYLGTGYSYEGGRHYYKDFWEYDPITNTWTQKTDVKGVHRSNAIGFSIGSKGYLGMGSFYNGTDYYDNQDFWEYDAFENDWTQKTDFVQNAREYAVGFSIGSKGYIGTGDAPGIGDKKDFWEYDPANNIWTQKADFGGTPRASAVGFSIGSKGYLGTGYSYNGADRYYYKDFWEYDPAINIWTQKADFAGVGRSNAIGFSIEGKGYLGTGFSTDGVSHYYKDFWEYNPAINEWMQKADFVGTGRWSAVGFGISGKGYLATGYSYDGLNKDFWEYDPIADTWIQKADFGGATRYGAVGFNIGNKGYIGTGHNNGKIHADFWEYDPTINTWTQKTNFGGTVRYDAVGFSIAGKGYLGTGYSYNGEHYWYKDFWEYDPGSVLPITYVSFDAAKQGSSVLLNWQSSTEGNNAYFSVERSSNGSDFTAIGQVKSKGNTNIAQQYHFTDAHPFKGGNYYRLKQSDADGHFTYSKIVSVVFGSTAGYKLYPNPVKDILQLENLNGNETILIVAQDGHVLDKKTVSTKTYNWDVKNLSAGTYYLQITNGEKTTTLKFVKE